MKKLLALVVTTMLISIAVSAQTAPDRFRKQRTVQGFSNGQITRFERMQLRKDQFHYRIAERKARRDGIVTPFERRNLSKIKRHNRGKLFRYKHNSRRRVI